MFSKRQYLTRKILRHIRPPIYVHTRQRFVTVGRDSLRPYLHHDHIVDLIMNPAQFTQHSVYFSTLQIDDKAEQLCSLHTWLIMAAPRRYERHAARRPEIICGRTGFIIIKSEQQIFSMLGAQQKYLEIFFNDSGTELLQILSIDLRMGVSFLPNCSDSILGIMAFQ